jgi:hypothetical protein
VNTTLRLDRLRLALDLREIDIDTRSKLTETETRLTAMTKCQCARLAQR